MVSQVHREDGAMSPAVDRPKVEHPFSHLWGIGFVNLLPSISLDGCSHIFEASGSADCKAIQSEAATREPET